MKTAGRCTALDRRRSARRTGPLFYDCACISAQQHNEPAGNHDVWHLHAHAFPRHHEGRLYERDREARWVAAEERALYASVLADVLCLPDSSPDAEPDN